MAESLATSRAPDADSKFRARQNVFYPQARVFLSVVFENFGDPESPKTFNVYPRAVKVYSNSYKEADTWSVEFDAQDFPTTPEMIRAGQAEIYLFQTRGVGQLPEVLKGDDVGSGSTFQGLAPTIVGLFDEGELAYSSDGKVMTIDGTDFTSLFIAQQWLPKKRVPTGVTLDKALQKLMDDVSGASAMTLTVEGDVGSLPVVGKAEGKTNKRGLPFRDAANYWDVMYKLAVRYGFIVFVRNLELVLTQPQALIAGKSQIRKMLWGRNLSSLRLSRRMAKEQVPVVEVRSYDDKARKIIKGRFPKNRKQVPVTGLGTKKNETRVYNIPGIRSKKQLESVAETTYNLIARAEQKVEIETMDLRDLEGQNLIELRAGDALSIGFDPFNSSTDLLEGQGEAQRVQTLRDLGYDAQIAAQIAAGFDRVNLFKRPFRVREATLDWSYDGGLVITAQLQNFVNIQGQQP